MIAGMTLRLIWVGEWVVMRTWSKMVEIVLCKRRLIDILVGMPLAFLPSFCSLN